MAEIPDTNDKRTEKDFIRVVIIATSLSFGLMFGFLSSVSGLPVEFNIAITKWTWVWSAVGLVFGWAFWKIILSLAAKRDKAGRPN